jgi:hypothetical protein
MHVNKVATDVRSNARSNAEQICLWKIKHLQTSMMGSTATLFFFCLR